MLTDANTETSSQNTPRQYRLKLLLNFLKDGNVGSVLPSSRFLCESICRLIDFPDTPSIIEFGAGEGTLTEALLRQMKSESSLLCFETNTNLVEILRERFSDPRLFIHHGSAEEVYSLCTEYKITPDLVISGIPLSFFSDETVLKLFEETARTLKKGGSLILYQSYFPAIISTHRIKNLLSHFFEIKQAQRVFMNIPPVEIIVSMPKST